jgi:hypothetical protein
MCIELGLGDGHVENWIPRLSLFKNDLVHIDLGNFNHVIWIGHRLSPPVILVKKIFFSLKT